MSLKQRFGEYTNGMKAAVMRGGAKEANRFFQDNAAALNMSLGLRILTVIITAVIGAAILAALLPTYLDSVGDVSENFTNGDVGNADVNAILPVFGLFVAFAGVFAIIGLALLVFRSRGS